MILFLRDQNNDTIADIECFIETEDDNRFIELHSSIDIHNYSKYLLNNLDNSREIIRIFDYLSELRGWLWERFFMGSKNDPEKYDEVIEILRKLLKGIAEKYKLHYVED
jgi:hypothetical protein